MNDVTCPRCGNPFTDPLLPTATAYRSVQTHSWGGRETCRVVVTVHPDGRRETEELATVPSPYETRVAPHPRGRHTVAWWVV